MAVDIYGDTSRKVLAKVRPSWRIWVEILINITECNERVEAVGGGRNLLISNEIVFRFRRCVTCAQNITTNKFEPIKKEIAFW